MSVVKKHLGIDLVDLAIHVFVTGLAMAFVNEIVLGPDADAIALTITAASALLFAWRRQRGLKRAASSPTGLTTGQMEAARIEELEQRLADLEAGQLRVAELEERLDFAERLLAQGTGERLLPGQERAR
ncbi:MAG: hypothetical protein FJ206_14940 [Gemmatimonadetes bacterium]|nr:hypothetical protein [Gemmatimonadota bacterium]